jgi:multicomponent Na+:H+ antiporter subunit E|tara:strand:- start:1308 stop:1787 length:480 start_codon:yes stop_codon:yes gene_type:complete
MIIKALLLFVFYFVIWLLLSGHYDPLLLTLGVLSCITCLYVTWKAKFIDEEGLPLHLLIRLPIYTLWLFKEIIKANIDTAKIIIFNNPDPQNFRVKSSQKTEAGKVTYANSITLTPGTVTTVLDGDILEVHALSSDMADDVKSGAMDKKVSWLEGNKNV